MRARTAEEDELIKNAEAVLIPPKLIEDLFPTELRHRIREFSPDKRLELTLPAGLGDRFIWFLHGSFKLLLGLVGLVRFKLEWITLGFQNGGRLMKMAFKEGETITFDFQTNQVRKRSTYDEPKSSRVILSIGQEGNHKVGQLLADGLVFYKTEHLPSAQAVIDELVPFWRALNYALGFDLNVEDVDEEA
jgi:hypothetical protein